MRTSLTIDTRAETGRSLALRLLWDIDAPFAVLNEYSVDRDDLFSNWRLCTADCVPLRSQTRSLASLVPFAKTLALCFVKTDSTFLLNYMTSGCINKQRLSVQVTASMSLVQVIATISTSLPEPHEEVRLAPRWLQLGLFNRHASSTLMKLGVGINSGLEFVLSSRMPAHKDFSDMCSNQINMYMPGSYIPFVIYYDPHVHTPRQLILHTKTLMLARRNCRMPAKTTKPVGIRVVLPGASPAQTLIPMSSGCGDMPFSGWPIMREAVAKCGVVILQIEWQN